MTAHPLPRMDDRPGHPEEEPASRRWGVRLVVLGLAATILSGNSYLLGLPVSPDRVLLPAGIALLFLGGHHRGLGTWRWRPVHGLMLAMIVWTAWSAAVHGTLLTAYGGYALLDRVLVPFLLFSVAPLVLRTDRDKRFLVKTFVVLGLYLGVTAFLEVAGPTSLVFPRYIMDPDVGILFGRARGPLVQAEANGMVLAACLFLSIWGVAAFRGRWRVAAGLAVPLTALGVVLTLTRSVWIGVALAGLVLVLAVPFLRRPLIVLIGSGTAALVAVLVASPALRQVLVDRLTTERSVYDRQNTNAAALRVIEQHPVDGIGWTRFVDKVVDLVRQADTYPVTNVEIEVHNVVLSRAAELGLIGAALWVACVLAGLGTAVLRVPPADLVRWRPVLMAFVCVWSVCIMVSPVPYVLPNYLVWLLAGSVLRDYLVESRPEPALAS